MLTPVASAVTRPTPTGADCRKSAYGNLYREAEGRLRRVFVMFNEGPRYEDSPAKADGEGWLVNDQEQEVVRFRNDIATAHA